MSLVTVTTRGGRELAVRFDQFPPELHQALEARIGELTEVLGAKITAAAVDKFAHPTGKLSSEIASRVYGNNSTRVAGYVSVFAGSDTHEYAKAATLEYGSQKPRKMAAKPGAGAWMRITGSSRRIYARMSGAVNIRAYRYLRDPFDELKPEAVAALAQVLASTVAASDIGIAA